MIWELRYLSMNREHTYDVPRKPTAPLCYLDTEQFKIAPLNNTIMTNATVSAAFSDKFLNSIV